MKGFQHIWHTIQNAILLCLVAVPCFAQTAGMDSLLARLQRYPEQTVERMRILSQIAEAYQTVNLDSMFRYCDMLLHEAQKGNSGQQQAHANVMMGKYWNSVQPEKALDYLLQACEFYQKTDDKEMLADASSQAALSYYLMGMYSHQINYLTKALHEILGTDNNKKLEIDILHDISVAYLHLGNYELAGEFTFLAIRESRNHDNWMLNEIVVAQAAIEYKKGNYTQAVKLGEENLKRIRKQGQAQLEAECLLNIAECRMMMGQYHEARHVLEQCRPKAEAQRKSSIYRAYLELSVGLDTITGHFAQAFNTQKEINRITAEKYSQERLQDNAEKALQEELQDMDRQLLILEAAKKQVTQSSAMNILIIALIIAASGGITLTVWAKRSLGKLNREKEQLLADKQKIADKKEKLLHNHHSLKQKQNLLQETHGRMEQSDRAKTELFKTISNDLQHPLVALQQDLTDMIASGISEEQFRESTAKLTASVGDLSLLLENLLQWSKCQSQGIQTRFQYIELMMLVNDLFSQQKYSALEKNILLSNMMEHHSYVYADEDTVKLLLKAILQNTVKLSDSRATVTFHGYRDNTYGYLRIGYRGSMPLKNTYMRLFYIDNYGSEKTELNKAISLGWMLCHELIKANNGNIRIEDTGRDSFDIHLSLPLDEAAGKYQAKQNRA
jgi:signal transduction histidine kinase